MAISKEVLLHADSPSHQATVDRLNGLLRSKSSVPAFSQVAVKLCSLAQNEDATIDDFTEVVALDAAVAARCLSVASSIGFAGRPIEQLQQALFIIGTRELRRIAFTVAMVGAFAGFSAKIDWKKFWFHNVLVARLTERIVRLCREVDGTEYLSGLLHDIGKVIIEHYFPSEFERIIIGAIEQQCPHAQVETTVLGVDHTQIGEAMCLQMQIHPHIRRAVRFHHDPLSPAHLAEPGSDGGFLAICVSAADQVANQVEKLRKEPGKPVSLAGLAPALGLLDPKTRPHTLDLDVHTEISATERDLSGLL